MPPTLMKMLAFALQLSVFSAAASCMDADSCVLGSDQTSLLHVRSVLQPGTERSSWDTDYFSAEVDGVQKPMIAVSTDPLQAGVFIGFDGQKPGMSSEDPPDFFSNQVRYQLNNEIISYLKTNLAKHPKVWDRPPLLLTVRRINIEVPNYQVERVAKCFGIEEHEFQPEVERSSWDTDYFSAEVDGVSKPRIAVSTDPLQTGIYIGVDGQTPSMSSEDPPDYLSNQVRYQLNDEVISYLRKQIAEHQPERPPLSLTIRRLHIEVPNSQVEQLAKCLGIEERIWKGQ